MAVRDIVLYADNQTTLRKKSEPVGVINPRIKNLIEDLKDTLAAYPEGIGLAAPQINVHRRVIVVRLGGGRDGHSEPGPPVALLNPEIVETGHEQKDSDGCLSFPGLFSETVRPHLVEVSALRQ